MNFADCWESFRAAQDWGSIPEWLGALGTVGAVAFALWSSHSSEKQLHRERLAAARQRAEGALDRKRLRDQLDRAALTARRAAARKVSLKLTSEPRADSKGDQLIRSRLEVRNGGSEPIKAVVTIARQMVDKGQEGKVTPFVPKAWRIIEGTTTHTALHDYPMDSFCRYEVQFSDSDDVRWVLDDLGTLEELDITSDRAITFVIYD